MLLATEPCPSFSLDRSRRSIARCPLAILDPQRLPAAHQFSFLVLAVVVGNYYLSMDQAPSSRSSPYVSISRFSHRHYPFQTGILHQAQDGSSPSVSSSSSRLDNGYWINECRCKLSLLRHEALVSSINSRLPMDTGWLE